MLAHDRRRILHFAVTAHPTAEWTTQQLPEAFSWDTAARYLPRDRHRIFGKELVDPLKAMGINQVLSAPRSPWQRADVERVIGAIRRECLDHGIVFGERSLYRHLQSFVDYDHRSRTHLGLEKDSPVPRPVQSADSLIVTSAAPHKGIFGEVPPALVEGPGAGLLTVARAAPVKRGNRPCQPATRGE